MKIRRCSIVAGSPIPVTQVALYKVIIDGDSYAFLTTNKASVQQYLDNYTANNSDMKARVWVLKQEAFGSGLRYVCVNDATYPLYRYSDLQSVSVLYEDGKYLQPIDKLRPINKPLSDLTLYHCRIANKITSHLDGVLIHPVHEIWKHFARLGDTLYGFDQDFERDDFLDHNKKSKQYVLGGTVMTQSTNYNKADYLFTLVAEAAKRIEDATGNPCTFDATNNSIRAIDETGKETVMLVGLEHEPRYMIYTVDGTPLMYFDTPEELTETLEGMLIQHHLTTL